MQSSSSARSVPQTNQNVVDVFFDGSCLENARGGYGAVLMSQAVELERISAYIGDFTTCNVAEYLGLIAALRACLRRKAVAVNACGDSELVILQMTGEYEVRSPLLKPLHAIAKGLERRFERVSFRHIPREQNLKADILARLGSSMSPIPRENRTLFYPSRCHTVRIDIGNTTINATHDVGTAESDDKIFIDASFLLDLPSYGPDALGDLEDPAPLTVCSGKTFLPVLGRLRKPLLIKVKTGKVIKAQITDAYVIHRLPVPLHLAAYNQQTAHLFERMAMPLYPTLEASLFPTQYHDHPFWDTSTIFLPYL